MGHLDVPLSRRGLFKTLCWRIGTIGDSMSRENGPLKHILERHLIYLIILSAQWQGLWDACEDVERPITSWSHWAPLRISWVDRDSSWASLEEVEDLRAPWMNEESWGPFTLGKITNTHWSVEGSAEDSPGTVSSLLNFLLLTPAQSLGDVAGTLVSEWSNSIVDIH